MCYGPLTSEMRRAAAAGRLSLGAGGSQSDRLAWLVDRPSKRQVSGPRPSPGQASPRVRRPGCGKVEFRFPRLVGGHDLPSARRARRRPSRAFLRPQVEVTGQSGAARTPCSSSQPSRALALRGYGCFKPPPPPGRRLFLCSLGWLYRSAAIRQFPQAWCRATAPGTNAARSRRPAARRCPCRLPAAAPRSA